METQDYLHLYSIFIAVTFLIGITNLIYNIRINRKTSYINTITSSRIKWIGKLRESISKFCGLTLHWVKGTVLKGSPQEQNLLEEIDLLRVLIELQLNRKDPKDNEIISLVREIPTLTDPKNKGTLEKRIAKLVEKSQDVLKIEWNRAKAESKEGDLEDKRMKIIDLLIAFSAFLFGMFIMFLIMKIL